MQKRKWDSRQAKDEAFKFEYVLVVNSERISETYPESVNAAARKMD